MKRKKYFLFIICFTLVILAIIIVGIVKNVRRISIVQVLQSVPKLFGGNTQEELDTNEYVIGENDDLVFIDDAAGNPVEIYVADNYDAVNITPEKIEITIGDEEVYIGHEEDGWVKVDKYLDINNENYNYEYINYDNDPKFLNPGIYKTNSEFMKENSYFIDIGNFENQQSIEYTTPIKVKYNQAISMNGNKYDIITEINSITVTQNEGYWTDENKVEPFYFGILTAIRTNADGWYKPDGSPWTEESGYTKRYKITGSYSAYPYFRFRHANDGEYLDKPKWEADVDIKYYIVDPDNPNVKCPFSGIFGLMDADFEGGIFVSDYNISDNKFYVKNSDYNNYLKADEFTGKAKVQYRKSYKGKTGLYLYDTADWEKLYEEGKITDEHTAIWDNFDVDGVTMSR
ncbi:MAG: hypothetical protein J5507_01580 [Clostridia bacterium]|nr:hypothetical protein [Clostridia bacterium]